MDRRRHRRLRIGEIRQHDAIAAAQLGRLPPPEGVPVAEGAILHAGRAIGGIHRRQRADMAPGAAPGPEVDRHAAAVVRDVEQLWPRLHPFDPRPVFRELVIGAGDVAGRAGRLEGARREGVRIDVFPKLRAAGRNQPLRLHLPGRLPRLGHHLRIVERGRCRPEQVADREPARGAPGWPVDLRLERQFPIAGLAYLAFGVKRRAGIGGNGKCRRKRAAGCMAKSLHAKCP